jgi:peptidoglycan hydrolase-like protein with peptidoglycan-binding domain
VKALQNRLNYLYRNFSDPLWFDNYPNNFGPYTQDPNKPLAVDGDFGNHTFNAVWDYQWWNGLQVDGVVGPQTWGSLGFCV